MKSGGVACPNSARGTDARRFLISMRIHGGLGVFGATEPTLSRNRRKSRMRKRDRIKSKNILPLFRRKAIQVLTACGADLSFNAMSELDLLIAVGHRSPAPLTVAMVGKYERLFRALKLIDPRKSRVQVRSPGKEFYASDEWRRVRYDALKKHGGKCQCCGSRKMPMHVDHIKPRSKYPWLELDVDNLQVLCEDCNMGKSNRDATDWRGR